MKSPWKNLVQLASRGRVVKEPERPRAENSAGFIPAPLLEASSEKAPNIEAASNITTAAVAGAEAAISTTVDRVSADHRLLSKLTRPSRKRKKRRSKAPVSEGAVTDAIKHGNVGSGVQQPPISFFEEIVALDEDIRQLRCQLAEKLLLQNTQLKKMLKRFGAP